MERYCKYCGAQLPPSGNFCGKCGMPVGSGEDMFGSAEPTVDSYHYGDMNSGRGAAGGPVRPRQKKPGNGKTVLLAVAASLVLLVGVALAVKLILELRGEKDAVQEPAYTETIAEAAPQDTPEQPAPQDTAPEAPMQEAPAQEEAEEDAGAYQPDRILELQPGQLNWVVVTGDYDLYFSVPEGFVETPIGFSVNGNIYCYYAQTLDMLVRVWEAPVDMAGDPAAAACALPMAFTWTRLPCRRRKTAAAIPAPEAAGGCPSMRRGGICMRITSCSNIRTAPCCIRRPMRTSPRRSFRVRPATMC